MSFRSICNDLCFSRFELCFQWKEYIWIVLVTHLSMILEHAYILNLKASVHSSLSFDWLILIIRHRTDTCMPEESSCSHYMNVISCGLIWSSPSEYQTLWLSFFFFLLHFNKWRVIEAFLDFRLINQHYYLYNEMSNTSLSVIESRFILVTNRNSISHISVCVDHFYCQHILFSEWLNIEVTRIWWWWIKRVFRPCNFLLGGEVVKEKKRGRTNWQNRKQSYINNS